MNIKKIAKRVVKQVKQERKSFKDYLQVRKSCIMMLTFAPKKVNVNNGRHLLETMGKDFLISQYNSLNKEWFYPYYLLYRRLKAKRKRFEKRNHFNEFAKTCKDSNLKGNRNTHYEARYDGKFEIAMCLALCSSICFDYKESYFNKIFKVFDKKLKQQVKIKEETI